MINPIASSTNKKHSITLRQRKLNNYGVLKIQGFRYI